MRAKSVFTGSMPDPVEVWNKVSPSSDIEMYFAPARGSCFEDTTTPNTGLPSGSVVHSIRLSDRNLIENAEIMIP
jgi:hypothetical protein